MARQGAATKSKGGAASTALARVGDPLVTGDGRQINPDGYVNGKKQAAPPPAVTLDAATYRPMKKRTLKELPCEVPLMNGIGAIFMYTIMGVGDREIADALKVSVEEVLEVRGHPSYKECFDSVVSTFIDKNSDLLAARIAGFSHAALDTVGHIAMNGGKEENKLRASIDLLDRAGVKPKDNAERTTVNSANELRIIVVEPSKETKVQFEFSTGQEVQDGNREE